MNLSHHELIALQKAITELYQPVSLRTVPLHILRVVSKLVTNDSISYNEINPRDLTNVHNIRLPREAEPQHIDALFAHAHQHPMAGSIRSGRATEARKFSDFITDLEFRNLDLYNEYYRLVGTRHQILFSFINSKSNQCCIALSRISHRDFSERDRTVLNLIRPHCAQAYRNCELLHHATHHDNFNKRHLLSVSNQGVIQWTSPGALEYLYELLGQYTDEGRLAPNIIRSWLNAHNPSAVGKSRPIELKNAVGQQAKLNIISCSEVDYTVVITPIETPARSSPSFFIQRLTAREKEVLHWINEGKTNLEIGIILKISARTAAKHVENILSKLGVENRHAAMRLSLEYHI